MRRVLVGGLVAVLLVLVQRRTRPFLWSDLFYALRLWRYRKQLQLRMRDGTGTFLGRFLQQAENLPDKVFIVFDEQTLTYAHVHRRSSRFANVLRDSVASGDIVALLMSNEPDFICVWFGLCKLGARTAFLNWNLKAAFLLQSVRTCGAKTLVVGAGWYMPPEFWTSTVYISRGLDLCACACRFGGFGPGDSSGSAEGRGARVGGR